MYFTDDSRRKQRKTYLENQHNFYGLALSEVGQYGQQTQITKPLKAIALPLLFYCSLQECLA